VKREINKFVIPTIALARRRNLKDYCLVIPLFFLIKKVEKKIKKQPNAPLAVSSQLTIISLINSKILHPVHQPLQSFNFQ